MDFERSPAGLHLDSRWISCSPCGVHVDSMLEISRLPYKVDKAGNPGSRLWGLIRQQFPLPSCYLIIFSYFIMFKNVSQCLFTIIVCIGGYYYGLLLLLCYLLCYIFVTVLYIYCSDDDSNQWLYEITNVSNLTILTARQLGHILEGRARLIYSNIGKLNTNGLANIRIAFKFNSCMS